MARGAARGAALVARGAAKRRRVGTATAASARWETLCDSATELRLGCTVTNGQSFNWTQAEEGWIGCVGDAAFALREHGASTQWRCISSAAPSSDDGLARLGLRLHRYFQLDHALAPRIARWGEADARCAAVACCIPGMRVMQQEPLECLISFICSSNNNISRITQMLRKLRAKYGRPLALAPPYDAHTLHTFPTAAELSRATEAELRDLGFGYRARFVVESTATVASNGGEAWLHALRAKPRDEVQSALMTLCGVGRKVADCVALFALDQAGCIPVDTHVWSIACRDYDPSLAQVKSLTPPVYERVGECFRSRFGDDAGWAHSLLFAAELPHFKVLLPKKFQEEMEAFRVVERAAKATKRAEAKARKAAKAAALAEQTTGAV